MNFSLPSSVSSPQDLTALTTDVQSYAKWLSQYSIASKAKTSYSAAHPEITPAAIELIRAASDQKSITEKQVDELIADLESFAKTAPVMTITLAAPLSVGTKKTLVDWCRTSIHPNILITFQFNSLLLGGMVLRTGSTIFDWSFRRSLLERKTRFTEVLDRV